MRTGIRNGEMIFPTGIAIASDDTAGKMHVFAAIEMPGRKVHQRVLASPARADDDDHDAAFGTSARMGFV